MQFDKIEAVVSLVFEQANNLLSKGHINAINKELKQKNIEILEEKSKRIELEKILRKNKELASSIALKSEYLFSSLSVISRLAYIENAKKTENSIYILSDMLRYTSDRRYSQISTLGEEIKYIDNYLKLQSIRLEERLKFNIDVSEEFFNIACPYMILQPIVENSIEYAVEPKKDGGEINISCNQKENDLIISIFDNGCGVSKETIENIMNENSMMKSELDRYDLYNINKCMIGLFGKKYGLIIENVSGNGTGTVVKLKLPIKSNIVK